LGEGDEAVGELVFGEVGPGLPVGVGQEDFDVGVVGGEGVGGVEDDGVEVFVA